MKKIEVIKIKSSILSFRDVILSNFKVGDRIEDFIKVEEDKLFITFSNHVVRNDVLAEIKVKYFVTKEDLEKEFGKQTMKEYLWDIFISYNLFYKLYNKMYEENIDKILKFASDRVLSAREDFYK